jgi:uncharacterized protein (DUF427 family)
VEGSRQLLRHTVNGEVNRDAACYYPAPKDAANNIKDYVAFWHGIVVV